MSVPEPRFADVIVPRHLHRTFTYSVPATLRASVKTGSLVQVPLGASTVTGVVVALPPAPPSGTAPFRLRDILAPADESAGTLAPDLLELSRQVADYYVAPWGQCLRLILPAMAAPLKPTRAKRKTPARPERVASVPSPAPPPLPHAGEPSWWPRLEQALSTRRHETFLVEGPLVSRWAILLNAADAARAKQNTVLIVSPEIRRAEALAAVSATRSRAAFWFLVMGSPVGDDAGAGRRNRRPVQ